MPCTRSGAGSAGMAPTDRAAAVRSVGKLAALMPILRAEAVVHRMGLSVRALLVTVSVALIGMVIAILVLFGAVALEMVYPGTFGKKNAGSFIAVVPVIVVVRVKAA